MASGSVFTPADPPPQGEGLLYIYRMPNSVNSAGQARFYLDGKKLFDLDADGYSYCYVPAGPHEVTQVYSVLGIVDPTAPKTYVEFNLHAGQTEYIRLDVMIAFVDNELSKVWGMAKRTADDAMPEIFQRHYQPADSCAK
jgi:hypothetical protein